LAQRNREVQLGAEPGSSVARLSVHLAADGPGLEWAFPDVVPRGARCREGALAIDFDEQALRATVDASASPCAPNIDGPWGNQRPDYFYAYYGEPVRGKLRLEPRDSRVAVGSKSEVVLASGRAALI